MAKPKKTEKQTYNKEKYIKNLKEAKQVYTKRKEFVKEFSLTKNKNGSKSGEKSVVAEATSANVQNSLSNYTANGKSSSELSKLSLKGSCGLTAKELNAWINPRTKSKKCKKCGSTSHMYNMGEIFLKAEKEAGYRADVIIAHSTEESGWGTSNIACTNKNFFGCGANDSNPAGDAYNWKNFEEGIVGAAKLISTGYIYRSQKHKGHKDQDSLWLMNNPPKENKGHRYASNNAWVENISNIWSGAPASSNEENKKSKKAKSIANQFNELENKKDPTNKGDYTILNPLPTGEDLMYIRKDRYNYSVPIGKMKGMKFKAPNYERESYVSLRKQSSQFKEKVEYKPLQDFIHLGGEHENLYSEESIELFTILKDKLGYRQLIVSRGFEHSITDNSSHSVGIAMDIYAPTPNEAIFIADTAWLMGIRSIAIGPKFVHVDTGPESSWSYGELVSYRGPGTVSAGGLQSGF